MDILSKRIQSLAESETLAMSKRSREMQAQGHDIINLSIGQPDFFTPAFIKEAGKKAIDDNITYYSPVAGFKEIREAIVKKLSRDNNLEYSAKNIVVSTGAKQSIANVMMSVLNPGDEVLVPVPYWVSYREIIRLAGVEPTYIQTDIANEFKVTPEDIEKYITDKTKLIIFSSPCNPTGSVYTKEELQALADLFEKYPNLLIVSDEIYEMINFEGAHESIAQFAQIKDRVIIINGVSKGFSMTGWRVGYMAAHETIAKAAEKFQGQITSGTCSIAQMASIKALETCPDEIEEMKTMLEAFRNRRNLLVSELNKIKGFKTYTPKGAFYIFPDISEILGKKHGNTQINNSVDLANYILEEGHVAVVPGSAFGDPNCIRISYATSEEKLIESVNRIKTVIEKLA